MNIINEFFVSFILIKLYFKFKVCRKIKFPLLWKFYFSKWKFYFSADIISGNILFVLTAFFCCIYVGWILGKQESLKELSNNNTLKSSWFGIWFYYVKYIVPLIILIIFIYGILN